MRRGSSATSGAVDTAAAVIGEALDAETAERLGLVTRALDGLDWEDEIRVFLEERASFSPDALTGLEANLRFGGPETMETKIFGRLSAWQNWIFQRAQCDRGGRRAVPLWQRPKAAIRYRADVNDNTRGAAKMDLINVDYSGRIPNNVGLTEDRQILRALEGWHPGYLDWWRAMGPEGFQEALVYLRTAVSVDPKGWAKFDYVRMPEYRWGILLAPQEADRRIAFGRHLGEPVWQEVPGEYRAMLRRLIVIQGDTEPASVEQQRHLGQHRAVALRPAQPVPGQCRGRTPSVGDGLPAAQVFRPRRPRRGGRAAAPPLRQRRRAAHARRLQRGDARLAVLFHVHHLHRPRRQDAA